MKPAAKKKVSLPTLEERVEALMDELEDALEALAAERRPEGVPQGVIRRLINAKGFGDCLCRSYLAATENDK
jgi:hypothetical protein